MVAMVERIEKLERSVRRFRWAGGTVVCLGAAGLLLGQNGTPKTSTVQPKILRADKIIAKNVVAENYELRRGEELRGRWLIGPREIAIFTMLRASGKGEATTDGSIWLTVGSEQAEFKMYAQDGHSSRWVTQSDGASFIRLGEKGDTCLSNWSTRPMVGSIFSLYDKIGNVRAALGRVSTVTKTTGVSHEHPESSLVLFDEKGNILHQVP